METYVTVVYETVEQAQQFVSLLFFVCSIAVFFPIIMPIFFNW